MNIKRICLLTIISITILVIPSVYAQLPFYNFNLKGSTYSFEVKNNHNAIDITSSNPIMLQTLVKKPLTLLLTSDNQISISMIEYNRDKSDTLDLDQTSWSNVNRLEIKSSSILLSSNKDIHFLIDSDNVSVGSNYDVAFVNATSLQIDAKQGEFDYYLSDIPDDAKISIDYFEPTPIGGWTNKIIHIHVSSQGGRVIPITGSFFIQNKINNLQIDSTANGETDMDMYKAAGKIALNTPQEMSTELSSADNVIFQKLFAITTIEERNDNAFPIESVGKASSILINDKDILSRAPPPEIFQNPWLITIIGGALATIIGTMVFQRRKK